MGWARVELARALRVESAALTEGKRLQVSTSAPIEIAHSDDGQAVGVTEEVRRSILCRHHERAESAYLRMQSSEVHGPHTDRDASLSVLPPYGACPTFVNEY